MLTSNSSSSQYQRENISSRPQRQSQLKTYQRYIHDSPISKLATLNQSNVNGSELHQKPKGNLYNYSNSKDNQKEIQQIRQRYKNINLRDFQKQNKLGHYQPKRRNSQYKKVDYDDQMQRIHKNNQTISKRHQESDLLSKQITYQPRSTFKQRNTEHPNNYDDLKKSYLQKISQASNSNYETFRESAREQSTRGRTASHQGTYNQVTRGNHLQSSYQNYQTNQLKRIKQELQKRQRRLENIRNNEKNNKQLDSHNKYKNQQNQSMVTPKKQPNNQKNSQQKQASDIQSPWFRHASSIYNQSYQNSDKKYSANNVSSLLDSINQNYWCKHTVTEEQSTIKNSMKSTLLYSNQKPSSNHKQIAKFQADFPKTRKVNFEDQDKIRQIQNKIKQRESQFRARQEQLRQKYAKVSNLSITSNRSQQKINQFKLAQKTQERTDKKQSINTEIQNIEKKIREFQSMKKKLNIEFQPYALQKNKTPTNSTRHERSASVMDKQVRKKVNNQENPSERVVYQRQFSKPAAGQKRCSFIQNTKPIYSQKTLNCRIPAQNSSKSNGFAFQLFRIQSETQQSSSNMSNISRIPSSSDLPSGSSSQKYLNQIQIQNKADGGMQERKKKLQNKVESNHAIKQLVNLLSQQTILDQQFRNTKIWFAGLSNNDKWKQLKYTLRERGLKFTVQHQKIQQFILSQDENNPFFSINQPSKFTVQYMIECYQKCENHWKQQIKGKFSEQQLTSQNFTQKKFDLDRKGFIGIQDLVRFLNIESGTFYRNRDLALISRRFSQLPNEKSTISQQNKDFSIKFSSIMKCLTNNKY